MLLVIDDKTGDWKRINKDEMENYPEEKILNISDRLKDRLDLKMSKIKDRNQDCIGIIDGKEGSGKSSLAGNCMRYISKDKFDPRVDMIGSNYEDALNKIEKVKKGGYLMFDEGNVFFMSTNVMTRQSKDLHEIFSIFRQKNLFVLICLPSFMRLGSYFAKDRASFLLSVYYKKDKKGNPYRFKYFSTKKKNQLYDSRSIKDKTIFIKSNFVSTFSKCLILENPEYKDFKLDTLVSSLTRARQKVAKKPLYPKDIELKTIRDVISRSDHLSAKEIAVIIGKTDRRVEQIRRELKLESISDFKNKNQLNPLEN